MVDLECAVAPIDLGNIRGQKGIHAVTHLILFVFNS